TSRWLPWTVVKTAWIRTAASSPALRTTWLTTDTFSSRSPTTREKKPWNWPNPLPVSPMPGSSRTTAAVIACWQGKRRKAHHDRRNLVARGGTDHPKAIVYNRVDLVGQPSRLSLARRAKSETHFPLRRNDRRDACPTNYCQMRLPCRSPQGQHRSEHDQPDDVQEMPVQRGGVDADMVLVVVSTGEGLADDQPHRQHATGYLRWGDQDQREH